MSRTSRLLRQCKVARNFILVSTNQSQSRGLLICRNDIHCQHRRNIASNANSHKETVKGVATPPLQLLSLPTTCPGCGAYAQDQKAGEPGFFSASRKAVKQFVGSKGSGTGGSGDHETETFTKVLNNADQSLLHLLGLQDEKIISRDFKDDQDLVSSDHSIEIPPPVCDRCHLLRHHKIGASVPHPTLESVRNIISESSFKYNHIYHVIDAADFPLSLIPSLQQYLSLSPQRSLNRRSKTTFYQHGLISEMSYIITRSDLLAPKKEQVDKIMPYIVDVLRNALGGSARNIRLGNVYCVSSKRGWWTKKLKENIYHQGGGWWMVGKVNVGKSNLFENIFPKGHTQDTISGSLRGKAQELCQPRSISSERISVGDTYQGIEGRMELAKEVPESSLLCTSLLPPTPKETPFPTMPLVSPSPGTTASPIRLSFGNRKGELVDLPGLNRGGLEPFVTDHHKQDLVMQNRIKAKQLTIKTGQSLLVGGLIQITSVTPDTIILAYPFVPLQCHVTSAGKAHSIVKGDGTSNLSTIARPGAGTRMQKAGTFPLRWDVTKARAGPLTAKAAVGLKTTALPFVVLSTDILIEGCGWIELVAQVRKKNFADSELAQTKNFFDDKEYPLVEIVSPDGKHVGCRRPIGAWLLGSEKPGTSGRDSKRPRQSMKGVKKRSKEISTIKSSLK